MNSEAKMKKPNT